jgi:hypothetical protein
MGLVGGGHRPQRPLGVGDADADLVDAGRERGGLHVTPVGDLDDDQPLFPGDDLVLAVVGARVLLAGQDGEQLVLPVDPADVREGVDEVGKRGPADRPARAGYAAGGSARGRARPPGHLLEERWCPVRGLRRRSMGARLGRRGTAGDRSHCSHLLGDEVKCRAIASAGALEPANGALGKGPARRLRAVGAEPASHAIPRRQGRSPSRTGRQGQCWTLVGTHRHPFQTRASLLAVGCPFMAARCTRDRREQRGSLAGRSNGWLAWAN